MRSIAKRCRTLVLVLAAGCAGKGSAPPTPVPNTPATQAASPADLPRSAPLSQSFLVTYERLWQALPLAYASLGMKVNAADTATRAVGFAAVVRRKIGGVPISKYFDCGRSQIDIIADAYDISLVVASQVGRSSQGGIVVTTHARASAKAPTIAHDIALCSSTGVLERALYDSLKVKLGR